jgi:hypothetical protein
MFEYCYKHFITVMNLSGESRRILSDNEPPIDVYSIDALNLLLDPLVLTKIYALQKTAFCIPFWATVEER